jgi:hypothetical protein
MKEDIGGLYPRMTDEERMIAAENLDRYLELAWEIWEESQSCDGRSLTEIPVSSTIKERSIPTI